MLAAVNGDGDRRQGPDALGSLRSVAVRGVGRLADAVDLAEHVVTGRGGGPGLSAAAWSVAKAAGMLAAAPVGIPALAVAARRTTEDSLGRIDSFGEHLRAVAEGRRGPLPANRVARADATQRWLITSDLHRSIPGRADWPRRQGTKDLYPRVLEHYAEQGWGLIENGDVEDFWLVGGSAWGAAYDIARIAGGIVATVDPGIEREVMAEHLDRIVANNAATYDLLRDAFIARGRYHRTVGNHDEALRDPWLAARLAAHIGAREPADMLLLGPPDASGAGAAGGIGAVEAVVAHGHLTDSWNGPGYSALGRVITWIALGLDDLPSPPVLSASSNGDGTLPDEEGVERLLAGRGRNRLVTLDPRFGGNRRFDSLDEERLFAALAADEPEGGWPWMVFGHTHYPMLEPVDRSGRRTRYANSGCGVLDHAVSALEWDPTTGGDPLRLVMWVDDDGTAVRHHLTADGPRLAVAD
jgi:hypothetical protein